jgi:hypothetical protein
MFGLNLDLPSIQSWNHVYIKICNNATLELNHPAKSTVTQLHQECTIITFFAFIFQLSLICLHFLYLKCILHMTSTKLICKTALKEFNNGNCKCNNTRKQQGYHFLAKTFCIVWFKYGEKN